MAFPNLFNEAMDIGSSISRTVNLSYTQGTTGTIEVNLIFATTGFNIAVDTIGNNNTNEPSSIDIAFTLANTSSVNVGDQGQAIFQISSDCGVTRFITFNINVTGCEFEVIPELEEVFVTVPSVGFEQVTVDYLVKQLGNLSGNVSVTTNDIVQLNAEQFSSSPCSYDCTPSFSFQVPATTVPAMYTYTLDFVSDCGYSVQKTLQVVIEALPRDCKQILKENTSASSGVYQIDIDGNGSLTPFDTYCDMTTDNGGWTLVLNYTRPAGSNPAPQYRSTTLPILDPATQLGNNQYNTVFWGHAVPSLLSLFDFEEVRFYGQRNNPATPTNIATLHFKHRQNDMVNYFKSGTGRINIIDLRNNFIPLTNHNTSLPLTANRSDSNKGNNALLYRPFYENGRREWRIRTGNGNDWNMDDRTNNTSNNTIHQVWIR